MSQYRVGYVCAKHGIPFKYMTIAGGEIPYCEFCTETQLEKSKWKCGKINPELAKAINQDRSKILSEKAIWKGKQIGVLGKKKPKPPKKYTSIFKQLNSERAKRVKTKGWMGK